MASDGPPADSPLFCDSCMTELTPGEGNFFVVEIDAVADPTPPNISDEDLAQNHDQKMAGLIDQMRDFSERELMDQVHRRLTLYLCNTCFSRWIENPTG